jgi:hypothetical protein
VPRDDLERLQMNRSMKLRIAHYLSGPVSTPHLT